jgi:hypothetical protein
MHTPTANDAYADVETTLEARARMQLQLALASGAAVLGLVGWLLTL